MCLLYLVQLWFQSFSLLFPIRNSSGLSSQ
jgi:hypothetical protein